MEKPKKYALKIKVNGYTITTVLISRHYLKKHGSYLNDEFILRLVTELDGGVFDVDSTTAGIDYFVADIEMGENPKVFRLIWLLEGPNLEVLGVINVYRRKGKKKP